MSLYLNVLNSGGKIYERYLDDDLVEKKRIVEDFQPSLFVENKSAVSNYKTIYGVPCVKCKFPSINEAGKASRNAAVGMLGQDDFGLQYISDKYNDEIDLSKYIKSIRVANFDIEVPAPKFPSANQAAYEITSIAHYDSILDKYTVFVMLGKSQRWSRDLSILDDDLLEKVDILTFTDEKSLLIGYLRFWRENCPVIVTGYNTDGFDIPYLYNRYCKVLSKPIADNLSPWGKVTRKQVIEWPMGIKASAKTDELKDELISKNKYHYDVNIFGIESLDWLQLYKKFSFTPQPSYRLDAIGESEINENKIHFRHNFMEVYGKSEIKQNKLYDDSHAYEYYAYMKHLLSEVGYKSIEPTEEVTAFMAGTEKDLLNVKNNIDKFKDLIVSDSNRCEQLYDYVSSKAIQLSFQMVTDYNVKDVELVNRLDAKRGFINLSISLAYYARINFSNVFSPIKTWDAIIFNSVKQNKVVLPGRSNARKQRYIGGYVKKPIKGLKKRIASFDLESLYPSIIRQVNISPETFVTKQEPNINFSNCSSELEDEEHGEIMYCIEELLSGNMIYDNSSYSLSSNGASYKKDVLGVIPEEITKVFKERKIHKRKMQKHEHNVKAIEKELRKRGLM